MRIRARGSGGKTVSAWAALGLLMAGLAACGCAPVSTGGPMKVAASIVPLADFTREVGREHVEVQTLVPPGASPHTFEPTTGQFAFLSDARVFVTNGLGLEAWASSVIGKVGNSSMLRVAAGDAVPVGLRIRAKVSGEEDVEGPYDPHVWLDPELAEYQVDAIAKALGKADPANRQAYLSNAAAYKQRLVALDSELEAQISSYRRKEFVALHPAWAYFARRYGLVQAAAIEELPGKEPSGRLISSIVSEIKARHIPVVFAEPQISAVAADIIAREAGARVLYIDPLGNPANPEVSTYIRMMHHDADVMGEALR